MKKEQHKFLAGCFIVAILFLVFLFSTMGSKVEKPNSKPKETQVFIQQTTTTKESTNLVDDVLNKTKEVLGQVGEVAKPVLETINNSQYVKDTKNFILDQWENITNKRSTYNSFYRELGKSNIDVTLFPNKGVTYSDLDDKGRTQSAYGIITNEMVQKSLGTREDWEGDASPSGWYTYKDKSGNYVTEEEYNQNPRLYKKESNNKEVSVKLNNGRIYNGWFYNRSHLIADSLGGRAFRNNVITGTRQQNVGNDDKKSGMQYIEMKVYNYILDNPNVSVYYSAEPVYIGEELIPRSVVVRALSSDGVIDEAIQVFNYANGYIIDYHNGTYKSK